MWIGVELPMDRGRFGLAEGDQGTHDHRQQDQQTGKIGCDLGTYHVEPLWPGSWLLATRANGRSPGVRTYPPDLFDLISGNHACAPLSARPSPRPRTEHSLLPIQSGYVGIIAVLAFRVKWER